MCIEVSGKMINKQGFGKEFIKAREEYFEGEFNEGTRHGDGKIINKKYEVIENEWRSGAASDTYKSKHLTTKDEYEKCVNRLVKAKQKTKPDVFIIV